MHLLRDNENRFTADNMNVSISVDSNYWFNKDWRAKLVLAEMYNDLFPVVQANPAPEEVLNAKILNQNSVRRAQSIWVSIRENPKSPPGPLTLAAISKAILEGADFSDPADRYAFFVFMQHNRDFRKLFRWMMHNANVSLSSEAAIVKRLREDFGAEILTPEEARILAQIWYVNDNPLRTLHLKIDNATFSQKSEFFKELFEYAPALAKAYSANPQLNQHEIPARRMPAAVQSIINEEALTHPGIVEAAVLGFEQSAGYLSNALDITEVETLMAQDIQWQCVIISGHPVCGNFNMQKLYRGRPLDPSALISQLQSPYFLPENWTEFKIWNTATHMPTGQFVIPDQDEIHFMFERMSNLVLNSMLYFTRHRRQDVKLLISRIANLNLSTEMPENRSRYLELRYRLYHPFTVQAMEEFWLENFDLFKLAAGKNDEYLCHLVGSMPNPSVFLKRMLSKKSRQPRIGSQVERWEYFGPRIAKLMPVLGQATVAQFENDFERVSNKRIRGAHSTEFLLHRFRSRIADLIAHYAAHSKDSGEELLSVLNDNHARELYEFSSVQLNDCLKAGVAGDVRTVNSRYELIIAREDGLFSKIAPEQLLREYQDLKLRNELPPAGSELAKHMALHPTIWARLNIHHQMEQRALKEYVQGSLLPPDLVAGRPAYSIGVREAYVIASNPSYWRAIDPYVQHPVRALAEWLMPGSQRAFFQREKQKLMSKNLIFGLRMEWANGYYRKQSFEQFLVGKYKRYVNSDFSLVWSVAPVVASQSQVSNGQVQAQALPAGGVVVLDATRAELATLFADIARGADLFELYKGGELALPKNRSQATAFLEQVNTPEKVVLAYDFIMRIDSANIDAEAVFHLITREESPSLAQVGDKKTCFELAKTLIEKNPALLPAVIDYHLQEANKISPHAMNKLVDWIESSCGDEGLVTSVVMQKLLRQSYLKNAVVNDIELFRRLIHQDLPAADLEAVIRGMILENQELREELSATDLLRLKNVFPSIFDELLAEGNNSILRHRIKNGLNRALLDRSGAQLQAIGVSGLGVFFRREPQFFYKFLLALPAALLDPPAAPLRAANDDIFMLNTSAHSEAFLKTMKEQSLVSPLNKDLVMRCVNSKNTQLAELMSFVLIEKLENAQPKEAAELLVEYLTREDASSKFIRSLISDGFSLKPCVQHLLLNLDFVQKNLAYNSETTTFSKVALKLWSALYQDRLVVSFINDLPSMKLSKEQRACMNKLCRYSDQYRLTLPAPQSVVPAVQLGESFSRLFRGFSGDQEVALAGVLSQSNN